MALSVSVIIVEMTTDVHFLLPILLAITVSKWVAESLSKARLPSSCLGCLGCCLRGGARRSDGGGGGAAGKACGGGGEGGLYRAVLEERGVPYLPQEPPGAGAHQSPPNQLKSLATPQPCPLTHPLPTPYPTHTLPRRRGAGPPPRLRHHAPGPRRVRRRMRAALRFAPLTSGVALPRLPRRAAAAGG